MKETTRSARPDRHAAVFPAVRDIRIGRDRARCQHEAGRMTRQLAVPGSCGQVSGRPVSRMYGWQVSAVHAAHIRAESRQDVFWSLTGLNDLFSCRWAGPCRTLPRKWARRVWKARTLAPRFPGGDGFRRRLRASASTSMVTSSPCRTTSEGITAFAEAARELSSTLDGQRHCSGRAVWGDPAFPTSSSTVLAHAVALDSRLSGSWLCDDPPSLPRHARRGAA